VGRRRGRRRRGPWRQFGGRRGQGAIGHPAASGERGRGPQSARAPTSTGNPGPPARQAHRARTARVARASAARSRAAMSSHLPDGGAGRLQRRRRRGRRRRRTSAVIHMELRRGRGRRRAAGSRHPRDRGGGSFAVYLWGSQRHDRVVHAPDRAGGHGETAVAAVGEAPADPGAPEVPTAAPANRTTLAAADRAGGRQRWRRRARRGRRGGPSVAWCARGLESDACLEHLQSRPGRQRRRVGGRNGAPASGRRSTRGNGSVGQCRTG